MESAGYYGLPKFGILGLLDALIPKIYLYRVGFLFLTSYKPWNTQVPFRHHYENIYASEAAAAGDLGVWCGCAVCQEVTFSFCQFNFSFVP